MIDPATPGGVAQHRSILHVDMDAFFASVELLDHPELRGKPVVVGGSGARGVVAAASYEARWFGVHSAMPSAIAKRKCPQAIFIDGRHGRYREVSGAVMAIFESFTPLVEPLSLDEAFLDVTGARRSIGDANHIAHAIRQAVLDDQGLTCSVGVAPNKFLAKLATESAKPKASRAGPVFGDGVAVVEPDRIFEFLWPLPAQAMWGVGPATLAKLQRIGVTTIGDIARLPVQALVSAVGTATGEHLHRLSQGIDDREVVVDTAPKSVSHEETFATDVDDRRRLERELVRMADSVATRLRAGGIVGRTITLKVRFAGFDTITRSRTVSAGIDDGFEIVDIAKGLLDAVDVSGGIRLLGVGASGLGQRGATQLQLDLDGGPSGSSTAASAERERINHAMDEIRGRFGKAAIGPATLVERAGGVGVFEEGQQQWGPNADRNP